VGDLEGGVSCQECELEESLADTRVLGRELGVWEGRFAVLMMDKEKGISFAFQNSQRQHIMIYY
jgi:hypothetical protein